MIILKVTKNQGVIPSLKNTLLEKPQREGGVELTLTLFRVNQKHFFISAVCESLSKNMNFCSLQLETLINIYSSSLPQGTFYWSSNTTTSIRIVYFFYIRICRCFLSYDFISSQCFHNILSSKIKFHFCH